MVRPPPTADEVSVIQPAVFASADSSSLWGSSGHERRPCSFTRLFGADSAVQSVIPDGSKYNYEVVGLHKYNSKHLEPPGHTEEVWYQSDGSDCFQETVSKR